MSAITREIFDTTALLKRVRNDYEYKGDDRTDNKIGLIYDAVFPTDDFAGLQLSVKIASLTPVITPEELARRENEGQKVFVKFEGLSIGCYNNKRTGASFSARAKKLTLVDGVAASPKPGGEK